MKPVAYRPVHAAGSLQHQRGLAFPLQTHEAAIGKF
jgi:hypothetical protein